MGVTGNMRARGAESLQFCAWGLQIWGVPRGLADPTDGLQIGAE
jgi:hypothetical protein